MIIPFLYHLYSLAQPFTSLEGQNTQCTARLNFLPQIEPLCCPPSVVVIFALLSVKD